MTRYFFVILLMALIGIAIVVKAGITMFAERQYWQDVADRFVKEKGRKKKKEGSGTPGFHPQCQYGFHLYRTSQNIPGQECSPIQGTPQERTPGKKP